MDYIRLCHCGRIQKYCSRRTYSNACRTNSECKKCSTKKSSLKIDRTFQRSEEYRLKMSKSLLLARKNSSTYNSDTYREKLRIAKLKQIDKLGVRATYNVSACKFIDDLNRKMGWNLQHALNGGEIQISGYLLDGYDISNKVVFEYDEPKHNSPSVKSKDKIRQSRIINTIRPKMFIRYDEQNNVMRDVISGKEIL